MKSNALNNKSNTMKKLFVAMMAVLVFASCGDDDKARSSGSVLDAMISKTETYKKEIQA